MKQLATIFIKDIAIDCALGVGEVERKQKQTILVSLDLVIDAAKASHSDDIKDTVSYSDLYRNSIARVSSTQYHLLEALASDILTFCLADKRILKATVRVEKPHILPQAKGVVLEMSKERI